MSDARAEHVRQRLAFANSSRRLSDIDTGARPLGPHSKKQRKRALREAADDIAGMQERLFAESTAGGRRSVLLLLQGIDTAGKGGVTEHVVGACGPIGVQYTAFKKPTAVEARHDFLWRIRKRVPPPGFLGIFDRSHYEDVLVPRVHNLISAAELQRRYDAINAFEKELIDNGTTVLKCFLHISSGTQRNRLIRRLERPDKHWKFNEGDIDERVHWDDYQEAFEAMLRQCDTESAPWYVVPADSKPYRNWAVGELLRTTLQDLDPKYPPTHLDVKRLKQRLRES